jgi:hypothetical protein
VGPYSEVGLFSSTHSPNCRSWEKEVGNGKPENTEGLNIQLLCILKTGEGTREHGKYKWQLWNTKIRVSECDIKNEWGHFISVATVCYHGVYRDTFTLPLLNIHIVLGHVRPSAQASHGHIVGPLGALWTTVDLLSIEFYVLYSNSDILYPRMVCLSSIMPHSYFAVFISYQSSCLLIDCLNIVSWFEVSVFKAATQMPSSSFIARFEVLTMMLCRLKSSLIYVQGSFVVSSTLFIMPQALIEIALHSSHADHMLQDLNCLYASSLNWTNQPLKPTNALICIVLL